MTVFLSASALGLASVVLGGAICCRREAWTWTAPAVGLSALLLIALVAIRLPGHGATAAGALAIALVLSVAALRRNRVDLRPVLYGVPTAAIALLLGSLPYLANRRIGELGASVADDLPFHMAQADAMREAGSSVALLGNGYPTGPHALVAALAEGTGIGIEAAFTGLLLAAPMLTALTALAAFDGLSWRRRTLGASLVGIPYLTAAYTVQGAFKEPLLALCFLGFALTLTEARREGRVKPRHATALVLIAAGGVADFGVVGLAWPAGTLVWLAVLEHASRAPAALQLVRRRLIPLVGASALLALAGLALAAWSGDFFSSGPGQYLTERGPGGNFVGQLSPFEAFGIWPVADFRFMRDARWWLEPGAALAAAVVLYGALWCWRRRERALLAAALAGVSVYVAARPVTLAYFSGKALAVASPVLVLIGIRALLGAQPRDGGTAPSRRAAWVAGVALFTLLAGYSSTLALRSAHVRPQERGPDMAAFRPIVRDKNTLYLGRDNYVAWDLRGARLWGFQNQNNKSIRRLTERGRKSTSDALAAVDVDSLDPRALDRFGFLVTTRTAYASHPPPNFEPVERSRWHVLWERRGPTRERLILDEGEAPGALLDCRRADGRRLSRAPGVAFVRPTPVVGEASAWRRPDGVRPRLPGVMVSGGSLVQELELGSGRWEIALRYYSDVPLRLRAGTSVHSAPAYIGDRSSFFGVGRLTTGGGRVRVEVTARERRRPDRIRILTLGSVAATRLDDPAHEVPLARACGSYVDWYRLATRPTGRLAPTPQPSYARLVAR